MQRAQNKTQAARNDEIIVLENSVNDNPKGQKRKFKIPPVMPESSPHS